MQNSIFWRLSYNRMYVTSLHTSKRRIRRTRSVLLGTIWKSRSFARSFTRFLYPILGWDNTLCSWNPLPNQGNPTEPDFFLLKWKGESINARRIEGSRRWSVSHHSITKLTFQSHGTRFDTPISSYSLRTRRSAPNGPKRS